jgi:outer membrane protein assembly factor BamB
LRWIGTVLVLFMTLIIVIAIPLSIMADSGIDQTDSSPWPMFRGNAQRNGLSSYDTSDNPGTLRWRLFLSANDRLSAPVIHPNGNIILNSLQGVWSISSDGSILWKIKDTLSLMMLMDYSISPPSPVITTEGTILVPRGDSIMALNPQGSLMWELNLTGPLLDPVIDSQGTIFLSAYGESLYSIDDRGNLRWSDNYSSGMTSPPSIDGNNCVYVGAGSEILSIAQDGSKRWSFKADGIIWEAPTISAEGMVYLVTQKGTLFALNDAGDSLWELETGIGPSGAPAINTDGSIFLPIFDESNDVGFMQKISNQGELIWKFKCGEGFSSPVISGNGDVVFYDHHDLYSLDSDGNLNWKYECIGNGWYHYEEVAIGNDGTIYIRSFNDMYAINTRPLSLSDTALINFVFIALFIPLIYLNFKLVKTKDRTRRGPILLLFSGGVLLIIQFVLYAFLEIFYDDFLFSLGYEPIPGINLISWFILGMTLILLASLSISDIRNSATYGTISILCALIALLTLGGFLVGSICALIGGILLVAEGLGSKSAFSS